MGLDINRHHVIHVTDRKIANQSDTICSMGYLRSSYNETGFNSLCHAHGLPGLYEIFGAACWDKKITGSEYYVMLEQDLIPAAIEVAQKTKDGLMELDAKMQSDGKKLHAYYIDTINIVLAMLTEMLDGYGLLLTWSA